MEDQKIPSRSERHKKKKEKPAKSGFFFSKIDEPETKPIKATPKKHTDVSGKDWYFTAPPVNDSPKDAVKDTGKAAAVTESESTDDHEFDNIVVSMSKPYREPVQEHKQKDLVIEKVVAEKASVEKAITEETASEKLSPSPRPHKKRRNLNPAVGFLLLLVMLVAGVCSGYAAMNAVLPPIDEYYANNAEQEMRDNINVLVLGCDEREGEDVARADVIIVATMRPGAKEASMFSIPRDTRVAIEGHGKDKINHAMSYGGIPLVQDSVENLLGIEIDHYVKVNFDGFINVIDALGGVNIEVPTRMYKPLEAIDLLPGYQTLDGADALAFVRWRGDGTGDYGRINRQQQFITALTDKVKSMSISQALNVADAIMDSIETDMSVRQMTSYGMNVLDMGTESIKTYSFVGNGIMINGVSYVEPDMTAISDIVNKMQHGEPKPEVVPEADPSADPTQAQQ